MAGDDLAVVGDEHRVSKAETLNGPGYLRDLFLRVGASVARIGAQICNVQFDYLTGRQRLKLQISL